VGSAPAVPVALVLRALGLGDLLVAVPALRLLRRALPGHRIVLAAPVALAPVISRIDAVDSLVGTAVVSDVAATGVPAPDVAVNLHGRGLESHAALDALAPRRRVGHAAPGWDGPEWTEDPRRSERRRWCDLLAGCGLVTAEEAAAGVDDVHLAPVPGRNDHVVIHPGAAFGSKRWPVDRFAAVARALAADGHRVVVTGGPAEGELTAAVAGACRGDDRGGATDLAELVDLVASARLVICGDTGVGHLATACGTPSVTLFGPVGPEQWGPPPGGPHVTATHASCRRGDRFVDDPDPALLAVGVDEVLVAAREVTAGVGVTRGSSINGGSGPLDGEAAHVR